MNLHEYQSKKILFDYGIPTPEGGPATSGKTARERASSLGGEAWMVKAQVHAGGRGKAGGIKRATSTDEVESIADRLIGTQLVTKQTTAEGQPINTVLVEATTEIESEFYLSMLSDSFVLYVDFRGRKDKERGLCAHDEHCCHMKSSPK